MKLRLALQVSDTANDEPWPEVGRTLIKLPLQTSLCFNAALDAEFKVHTSLPWSCNYHSRCTRAVLWSGLWPRVIHHAWHVSQIWIEWDDGNSLPLYDFGGETYSWPKWCTDSTPSFKSEAKNRCCPLLVSCSIYWILHFCHRVGPGLNWKWKGQSECLYCNYLTCWNRMEGPLVTLIPSLFSATKC